MTSGVGRLGLSSLKWSGLLALRDRGLPVPEAVLYERLPKHFPNELGPDVIVRPSVRGVSWQDPHAAQLHSGSWPSRLANKTCWGDVISWIERVSPGCDYVVQRYVRHQRAFLMHIDSEQGVARLAVGELLTDLCNGAAAEIECWLDLVEGSIVSVESLCQGQWTLLESLLVFRDRLQRLPEGSTWELEGCMGLEQQLQFVQCQASTERLAPW